MPLYTVPRNPQMGSSVNASWGASLVGSVGALRPISTPGVLVGKRAHGTTMEFLPQDAQQEPEFNAPRPFDVRWYRFNGDGKDADKGEWQIFLPIGCMTLMQRGGSAAGVASYPYIPTNEKAKDADGKEIPGWYSLEEPKDGTDDDVTKMDDGRVARSWAVTLMMKPWASMTATAMPSKEETAYAWTETVATIGVVSSGQEDGEDQHVWQSFKAEGGVTSISKEWDASGTFGILYEWSGKGEPKAYITNKMMYIGRTQLTEDGDTDISSWKNAEVWLKIRHDSEKLESSIEKDLDGETSNDDQTVGRIYKLKDLVVISDTRHQYPQLDFYTVSESKGTE